MPQGTASPPHTSTLTPHTSQNEIRAFWEDAAVDHGTYAQGSWKYNLTRFIETRVCKKADHVAILATA